MNNPKSSSSQQSLLNIFNRLEHISTHRPNRYYPTDGLDNPECTNGKRAAMAAEALRCFQNEFGMGEEIVIASADLVGDLLHLVHSHGFNPKQIIEDGITHFLCEAETLK